MKMEWKKNYAFSQQQERSQLLFLVTLFGLIFQGSDGVKDVQLEGPRYARRGEDLMLRCNYDLETDYLYAVKWYRGSEEFYRFLPKESPPKQAFPIPGVLVDVNKSDEHGVFLRNLSFETNGRFKCVISAEGTFQTLENAKDIDVVVIDYNSPKLFLDKMSYQPGDRGLANCSIERTFPAPNITWFINGKKVNFSVVTTVVKVPEEERPGSRMKSVSLSPFPTTTHIPTSFTSNVIVKNVKGGGGGGSGGTRGANTNINSNASSFATSRTTSTSSSIFRTTTMAKSNSSSKGGGGNGKDDDGGGGGSKLTSSVSTLSFPIHGYSPLTIKCTGQLYDVYNETSYIQIQPKAPLLYPYPTVSTPRSQRKWNNGLPDQLQTYNSSHIGNHGGHNAKPFTTLLTTLLLARIATNAQALLLALLQ